MGQYGYTTGSEQLDESIDGLIAAAGATANQDVLREIMVTAIKLIADNAERADLKIINSTFKELRYSLKVFKQYRKIPKVSVFGSARTKENDPGYLQAKYFSAEIAKRGWMVITGAGPGIMEAATKGAGREKAFGINIRLPFEQKPNVEISGDKKLINFKYFFTRKIFFLREAKAIVLLPGGFGTFDEGYEALTLLQTGKSDPKPVVLLEGEGSDFWTKWVEFFHKEMIPRKLISQEDTRLFFKTKKVKEAVEEIIGFYYNYHSIRYVRDLLVVRVNKVTKKMLKRANSEFTDLLVKGDFETSSALPEEANEPLLAEKPRIVFCFNRASFARLRAFIDMLNEEAKQSGS